MIPTDLLPDDKDAPSCPVCDQELPKDTPSTRDLRESLQSLRARLSEATRDEPRLRRMLVNVEQHQDELRERLISIDDALDALGRQQQEVERLGIALNEQSYVRGRIDHYLREVHEASNASLAEISRRIGDLVTTIDALRIANRV